MGPSAAGAPEVAPDQELGLREEPGGTATPAGSATRTAAAMLGSRRAGVAMKPHSSMRSASSAAARAVVRVRVRRSGQQVTGNLEDTPGRASLERPYTQARRWAVPRRLGVLRALQKHT